MNLNKKLVKTMVFALGLGTVSLLGTNTVKAVDPAKPTGTNITLNAADENLAVNDTDKANALFWAVAKEIKTEKGAVLSEGDKHYKLGDVEPVVGQTIDVSSFSKKKDIVIAIGATEKPSTDKWIIKTIPAQNKEFKFEYMPVAGDKIKKINSINVETHGLGDAENGYLVYSTTKEGGAEAFTVDSLEKIMIQEGEGAWSTFKVYFNGNKATVSKDDVVAKLSNLLATGKSLNVRLKDDTSWNSNVVKLKIKAQANAPKVKLDSAKETTSLKKGMEYKLQVKGKNIPNNWTKVEGKLGFKELDIYGAADTSVGGQGGTLYVRTATTDKKMASKTSEIAITKTDAPASVTNVTDQGKDIVAKLNLSLKVKYNFKKGAELVNSSDDTDYEYYISADGNPVDKPKWKLLKKQKTDKKGVKKPTKVAIKYSAEGKEGTYKDTGSKIFFRIAGEKQVGNTIKISSLTKEASITFTDIAQNMSAAAVPTEGLTVTNETASTIKVKKATAKEYKIAFTLTNLQKKGSSPKVKVLDKLSGVSVKMSKYATAGSADKSIATIKISKSAFKEASAGNVLKFEITSEGNKTVHTVTITAE